MQSHCPYGFAYLNPELAFPGSKNSLQPCSILPAQGAEAAKTANYQLDAGPPSSTWAPVGCIPHS